MAYLAIIPARGGSKRIHKKNLAKLGKHSLLGWAILCAQGTRDIDDILVSTDDLEIAQEAQGYGVKVEWLRPNSLASDDAKTIDVLLFELNEYIKQKSIIPHNCVLLEPTAPLRTPEILKSAIEMFPICSGR
ncbi:MAG: hypothetical protein IPJ74_09105 [Saprospiraceae bacterium]|nr:hypothetical protein [Saprospiraceae bacterium]